jgi:hypothetical protein
MCQPIVTLRESSIVQGHYEPVMNVNDPTSSTCEADRFSDSNAYNNRNTKTKTSGGGIRRRSACFMEEDDSSCHSFTSRTSAVSTSCSSSSQESFSRSSPCNAGEDKESPPPFPERRRRRGRKVVFDNEVQCNIIPSCKHHISEEERADVWMTPDDFKRIAQKCCKIVKILETGKGCRSRGLESHTRQGAIAKQLTRSNSIQTVLFEQSQGSSSDVIARAYHAATSSSQLWACTVALKDQKVAESII